MSKSRRSFLKLSALNPKSFAVHSIKKPTASQVKSFQRNYDLVKMPMGVSTKYAFNSKSIYDATLSLIEEETQEFMGRN